MNHYLIWIACSVSGGYRTYKQKPVRDTTNMTWRGDYDGKGQVALAHLEALGITLPSMTWEDEPVKLKISAEIWEDQEK